MLDPLQPQSKPEVVELRDASRLLGAEMPSAYVRANPVGLTREDIWSASNSLVTMGFTMDLEKSMLALCLVRELNPLPPRARFHHLEVALELRSKLTVEL